MLIPEKEEPCLPMLVRAADLVGVEPTNVSILVVVPEVNPRSYENEVNTPKVCVVLHKVVPASYKYLCEYIPGNPHTSPSLPHSPYHFSSLPTLLLSNSLSLSTHLPPPTHTQTYTFSLLPI